MVDGLGLELGLGKKLNDIIQNVNYSKIKLCGSFSHNEIFRVPLKFNSNSWFMNNNRHDVM